MVGATLCIAIVACLEPGRPHLAARDTTPPRVVRIVPLGDPPISPSADAGGDGGVGDGGVGDAGSDVGPGLLAPSGELLITFSEPMDRRSLVAGIWLLSADGQRLPIAIEVPPEGVIPQAVQQDDREYTLRVVLPQEFPVDATVTLVLDTVLTDTEGNRLQGLDGGTEQIRVRFGTVICGDDAHCQPPTRACDRTVPKGTCVACVGNQHCFAPTPFCDPNRQACVQCVQAADCPGAGQTCVSNQCEP
jgi:hypothetical protein